MPNSSVLERQVRISLIGMSAAKLLEKYLAIAIISAIPGRVEEWGFNRVRYGEERTSASVLALRAALSIAYIFLPSKRFKNFYQILIESNIYSNLLPVWIRRGI